MSARVKISFTLNGRPQRVNVPPMKRLLDVLRDECGLTGTKEGCGEGECGACTVLLAGDPVNSCLVPALHAEGAKIVTVEGLARGAKLSALQTAFIELGGAQCGMCTPGMLVTSAALLDRTKGRVPSNAEVRDALSGTLCRCTGYQKIVDAVRAAAKPAPAKKKPAAKKKVATKKKAATKKKPAAKKKAAAKKKRATR
ncbi:MAG: (2Fe-2S)-binding protein [Candidatus Eisenbacteria bacterium]|nr:(2Fe-2S)-binding protein [Candidatus Eisenbacteria bacterium]